MAGEPELREGTSSQWVQYLQQLLRYRGYWQGSDTGAFDEEVRRAVIAFQSAAHLTADGVVGEATWAALTAPTSPTDQQYSSRTTESSAPPDATAVHRDIPDAGAPDATVDIRNQPHDLKPTGAQPQQVPATFNMGGRPAFRYNLPNVELARAEFDTGDLWVEVTFNMRGNVTITFEDPARCMSVDQTGLRLEATQALGPLTQGLRVSGLGSESPSIGVTLGTQFDQTEVRFTPPNTMTFIGQARVGYTVSSTTVGPISVQGQPGFDLKVTATPHVSVPVRIESQTDWFRELAPALAAAGVVVLVALAIAAAPETGGASLVPLAAAL